PARPGPGAGRAGRLGFARRRRGLEAGHPGRARPPDGRSPAERLGPPARPPPPPRQHRGPPRLRRETGPAMAVGGAGGGVGEVEGFLRGVLPGAWVAAVDRDDPEALGLARRGVEPGELWARLGARGYVVPTWPREYGGLGVERAVGAAI